MTSAQLTNLHILPSKYLPSLASLDSAFQLQEYISLLIRLDVHDVDNPPKGENRDEQGHGVKEGEKGKSEDTVDKAYWTCEQLRYVFGVPINKRRTYRASGALCRIYLTPLLRLCSWNICGLRVQR
jgi:hypothetical protein